MLPTRRYTPKEKEQAVRLVRQLRTELGTKQGMIQRVAKQLGYGTESVRAWVRQTDINDGHKPGVTTEQVDQITALDGRVGFSLDELVGDASTLLLTAGQTANRITARRAAHCT